MLTCFYGNLKKNQINIAYWCAQMNFDAENSDYLYLIKNN